MDDLLKFAFAAMGIYLIYQMSQQQQEPYLAPYYAPYYAPYFPVFSRGWLMYPGGGWRPPLPPPPVGDGEHGEMGAGFGGTHAK